MIVGSVKLKLYVPFSHSLKEKRMTVKSIIEKAKHRFNISIAEVEEMDNHQIIVIGIACVSNSSKLTYSILSKAVAFIERSTEAQIVGVDYEI